MSLDGKYWLCWGDLSRFFVAFAEIQTYWTPLTHWDRDKIAVISQTTFSNAYSWIKMNEFCLRFHWNLFLVFEFTIFNHWFRKWLEAAQATSHYLNQWWLVYWRIYASFGLNELKLWGCSNTFPVAVIMNTKLYQRIKCHSGILPRNWIWIWGLFV